MPDKETMQVAIYQINTDLFPDLSIKQMIENMVREYNNNSPEEKWFLEQNLKSGLEFNNFNVKVFYSQKPSTPKWIGFLRPILDANAELLCGRNLIISLVAFIYNENDIFAISGGQGNYLISNFINPDFGLDIISRLISEDSKVIKSLDERGLTGRLLATSKFFRFDSKLVDEDDFGKLYKQVKAELNEDTLSEKLGLSPEEVKKDVGCVAKSSFKLNKSITFQTFLRVINHLTKLLDTEPKFNLNKAKHLTGRDKKSRQLIVELKQNIGQLILEKYSCNDPNVDLDICHYEYDKFLFASSYNLYYSSSAKPIFDEPLDEIKDFSFLFDAIRKRQRCINSPGQMVDFMEKLKLKSFDAEGQILTQWPLFRQLSGDMAYDGKIYFIVDGEWYAIDNDFLDNLNKNINEVISETFFSGILDVPCVYMSEDDYNEKYIGKKDCLVFHKVLVRNTEVCDILKWDQEHVYFIHVKRGFKSSTRELASQVQIAARVIREANATGCYSFFNKLYESLENKRNSTSQYFIKASHQTQGISQDDLLCIISSKKPVLCLAFLEINNTDELVSSQSNIAKYSVVELHRMLKSWDLPMRITTIR